ncbi:DUF7577 domain-containing protein [Halorubrum sp. HHNYT27]|uniref:DUF7577 domain-containing protein n=1 Tax=Halorubrum sp. HHNYT27 TaxID=3402275 RepID=UPI003EBB8680
MTGGNLLPVAAVFIGVVVANLALAWLLARRDWEPPDVLDSGGRSPPSESAPAASDAEAHPTDDPEFAVGTGSERAVTKGNPPPLDVDGETVVCRHCGAENRPDFHYCRWCVRSGFDAADVGAGAGSAMSERSL